MTENFATLEVTDLVAELIRREDRVPLALFEACVARGDALLSRLRAILSRPEHWEGECPEGEWWLALHAAKIAGRLSSPAAAEMLLLLLECVERYPDDPIFEWIGCFAVLWLNKPARFLPALRARAEAASDPAAAYDAAYCAVALASQAGPDTFEETLDWVAQLASDASRDADTRYMLGNLLLDFPRERHRPLLMRLAEEQQQLLMPYFDRHCVERAFTVGDKPEWEGAEAPDAFYQPEAIARRHARAIASSPKETTKSQPAQTGTYVRQQPKIGRNDPCPCGSGKKYKKCCLQ